MAMRLAVPLTVRLGALLLCAALSQPAGAEPTVILLSWDGVRHDYLDRVETPALTRMSREGARAERLVPVFPSNTFPGHVSLATGTYPDRHGIVDNQFYDRGRGVFRMANDASWIEAEPLWVAAERQGVPTAVHFWVGSETDWQGIGARHRKAPFDSRVTERAKVDQMLAWLDLPEGERPRLIMGWWHGADHTGHLHGPDDSRIEAALTQQSVELGRLLDGIDARGLWPETTLLIASDHGMTKVVGEIALPAVLENARIGARVEEGSSVAHVFLADPGDSERALAVLAEVPHVRALRRDAVPAALRIVHPTRTGDLVVIAEPGYVFRRKISRTGLWRRVSGWLGGHTGIHGYAPDHPDMGGILLALGRGVPHGANLGVVRMIDVAATVAKLLGIEPPRHSEGRPIPGLLDGSPLPDRS